MGAQDTSKEQTDERTNETNKKRQGQEGMATNETKAGAPTAEAKEGAKEGKYFASEMQRKR